MDIAVVCKSVVGSVSNVGIIAVAVEWEQPVETTQCVMVWTLAVGHTQSALVWDQNAVQDPSVQDLVQNVKVALNMANQLLTLVKGIMVAHLWSHSNQWSHLSLSSHSSPSNPCLTQQLNMCITMAALLEMLAAVARVSHK